MSSPWVYRALVALLGLLAIGGCAGPAVSLAPLRAEPTLAGPTRDVWVVRHGWHTRVAVRFTDIDSRLWPESREFGEAAYVEVGWGDRDFYPNPDPRVWDAIDAVVRATPAALHVGVLDVPPPAVFGDEGTVRVSVPAAGIERLSRFIAGHYVRDAGGSPVRIRAGQYPRSAFYLAKGRYHALTYNSNNWTASALQAAGASMDPASAMTASTVMRQAAEIATRSRDGQAHPGR